MAACLFEGTTPLGTPRCSASLNDVIWGFRFRCALQLSSVGVLWVSLVVLLLGVAAVAQAFPLQPADADCLGAGVGPYYPPLNSPPVVRAMRYAAQSGTPAGAACFEKTGSAATWVTVASVIRTADTTSAFIARFGAISELLTVQYWSTTDQKWRPLVSSASAIAGTTSTQSRADYSPAELVKGEDRYYLITDTRSGRATKYRLRLRAVRPGHVVVETANIEPIEWWGITLFPANGLDTLYFLDERSHGVWAYYSITRVLPATLLAAGHQKSYINRATALYRHYMRLPIDAEPPAAP